MQSQHRMEWRCVARNHEPLAFALGDEYMDHMKTLHSGYSDAQLSDTGKASCGPITPLFESCPFCGKRSGDLDVHIGDHLRYLALLSLPWPDDADTSPRGSIVGSVSSQKAYSMGYSLSGSDIQLIQDWDTGPADAEPGYSGDAPAEYELLCPG